jgi:ribosome-associated toxin RatA of RatAB toxin-antitoxin module/CRP-like cAMP-binding protein
LEVKRSVLLPYSVEDMYDLIEKAETYPQYLPWCVSAKILERSDELVSARLEFSYLRIRFGFQTRNPKRRPEWLQVRLVEGPFKHLVGDWHFTPIGGLGCRIDFAMNFEVADGRLDALAGPAASLVAKAMVDAFVKRAAATLKEFAPAQIAPPAPAQTAVAAAPAPAPVAPVVGVAPEPVPLRAGPSAAVPAEADVTSTPSTLIDDVIASPLARFLTPEQAAVLARVVTSATHAPKDVLAREGASDNHLYVVAEGALGVVKHLGTPEETQITTLARGDFAHELGFLDGAERYASLVASNAARVLVLEREGLESLIESHPRVVYNVMRAIAANVHRTQTKLSVQAAELTNYIVKQHGRY